MIAPARHHPAQRCTAMTAWRWNGIFSEHGRLCRYGDAPDRACDILEHPFWGLGKKPHVPQPAAGCNRLDGLHDGVSRVYDRRREWHDDAH